MNNIMISVIVPVYNVEKYLEKSLKSLSEQAIDSIEFICVNDGSKDRSLDILNDFAERDHRFKIINQENRGVSEARNAALDAANGEYIMFMDSDDWYSVDACKRAYDIILQYNADIAFYSMDMEYSDHSEHRSIFDEPFTIFNRDECRKLNRKCIGLIGDECKNINKLDYLSLLYLKIYRREIIEKNNIRFFDLKEIGSLEDGIFVMQYMKYVNKAVYVDEPLYHYNRCNPESITTKYRSDLQQKWAKQFSVIREKICEDDHVNLWALSNRMAYATFTLGLNAVSGEQSIKEKFCSVRKIFHGNADYRSFFMREILVMPKALAVYFFLAKYKLSLVTFLLLIMMQYTRNRRKGLG